MAAALAAAAKGWRRKRQLGRRQRGGRRHISVGNASGIAGGGVA